MPQEKEHINPRILFLLHPVQGEAFLTGVILFHSISLQLWMEKVGEDNIPSLQYNNTTYDTIQ